MNMLADFASFYFRFVWSLSIYGGIIGLLGGIIIAHIFVVPVWWFKSWKPWAMVAGLGVVIVLFGLFMLLLFPRASLPETPRLAAIPGEWVLVMNQGAWDTPLDGFTTEAECLAKIQRLYDSAERSGIPPPRDYECRGRNHVRPFNPR